MSVDSQALLTALQAVIDPNTGRDFVTSKALKNLQSTDGDVSFDVELGYTWQDITEVNPGTSSTAQSNWDNLATDDINNPKESTSNYEIKHNAVAAVKWSEEFRPARAALIATPLLALAACLATPVKHHVSVSCSMFQKTPTMCSLPAG